MANYTGKYAYPWSNDVRPAVDAGGFKVGWLLWGFQMGWDTNDPHNVNVRGPMKRYDKMRRSFP